VKLIYKKKLIKHFVRPDVRSTMDFVILEKTFIFYNLGIILFPTRSRTGQPHYLPLSDEAIKKYVWESAVGPHQE
jgi:hypothetical protein